MERNSQSEPIIVSMEDPNKENKAVTMLDQVAPGDVKIERHATFYVEDEPPTSAQEEKKVSEKEKLVRYIDDNLIGKDQTFVGPFGRRKGCHCSPINPTQTEGRKVV
ncbi:unnamed protein product [Nesidiocoris tenuis]|uniref:Uncharacterized protein n=1 Tax=Nesidiocoris tenuis TaxID=355587 RepID=A0A6H5FZ50_9HEMI|nr:unnamed protein product [Nesidiocoris tenuis]